MNVRLRAVTLAVVVMLLAACTSMPTSGPPVRSNVVASDEGRAAPLPEGPQAGAGPVDIVQSFLIAGANGFPDEFVTARQYLAGDARQAWKPLAGVVVAGPLTYSTTSKTQVTVDVPVLARVDGDGRYTEAPPDARESVTYDLVRNADGEWRISGVPDGLLLPKVVFDARFRAASIYFLSADETFLVPETRWLPQDKLPTHVMKALLAGPSPWLRDAVVTEIPDGTQLKPEAVVITGAGTAEVGLEPAATVLAAKRKLFLAQIDASLRPLPGVGSVKVTAGGVDGVILEGAATLQQGPTPDVPVEMLQAGKLVSLAGGTVKPVDGIGSLEGLGIRYPARDEDGDVRVGVSGGSSLVTLPQGGKAGTTLLTGADLVAPSVDRFGWAWTATTADGLVAGRAGAKPVSITADFLQGRQVRSVRVARDGTRVAVISSGPDGVAINVGAVVRDANGAPQQIGEVIRAGSLLTDATALVWKDESTLAVVGRSAGTLAVHLVPVSGTTSALPEVPDLDAVAGGSVLYATSKDGMLRRYTASSWTAVPGVEGVLDPSFPG
ncbi:LpqB family beta-propeller domain-containing protein [Cellulomonas sp. PhB150]|uniref:LpqB family beta-propeller domain-containing protein n=1 Tax=Cellulomonas sp. PhB150 TaxID=2485188 RepID=UPI000F48A35F|nr:LpqB family beta-propeller domain-containing protein [Cellulomonas sp. PhB150]ROS31181.1 sporulation and spore germination protein [Cellulomonas sp. PhB150]